MMSHIDMELLKKYDKAGPRYTSYPTAPHFSTNFSLEDLEKERTEAFEKRLSQPLSLYFHVPYCKAICAYCACHTELSNDPERIAKYVKTMRQELAQFAERFPTKRPVKQVHFGGGTPTHIGLPALEALMNDMHRYFCFADDVEIAIEVDPRRVVSQDLTELKKIGFNRISFGIQDLDPKVQRAVGRIQSPELCAQMVSDAHAAGFGSVNVDLIYGLPYQTLEGQRRTLDFVVEKIQPDRMAVFNFAYLPQLRLNQEGIRPETLPNGETKLLLLKQAIEVFTQGGYDFIGLDHFARPTDSLARALREGRLHRNFQGYTTLHDVEIVGFGVSSISQFENVYYQNTKDEALYHSQILAGLPPLDRGIRLSADDHLRRHVIMAILCQGNIVKSEIEKRFGIVFDSYFQDALQQMSEFVADGLLRMNDQSLEVTTQGRLFIRNIAMAFDGRLRQATQGRQPTYSRTV